MAKNFLTNPKEEAKSNRKGHNKNIQALISKSVCVSNYKTFKLFLCDPNKSNKMKIVGYRPKREVLSHLRC